MENEINGNLGIRALADTNLMEWSATPSGSVWRKRLHLVGPKESGQVTSIVRYDPNSSFPAHNHPEGEEIFVLEGVFSDEYGNWPAGTYLLNPAGFRHSPFSKQGCLLFVKLRQFSGENRVHIAACTNEIPWQKKSNPGVWQKTLYKQDGFSDIVRLERWIPGAELGTIRYALGAELFVLKGKFADENGQYRKGCWLRFPVGSEHNPHTSKGCELYVKVSGLPYLRQGTR